jgi:uncharacterized protein YggE
MEGTSYWRKEYVQVLLTIVLVGVIAALASYAYYTIKQSEGVYTGAATITVQGTGEVNAKPDIGQFSFSVLAEGTDASEAQNKSAQSINAIMDYLKGAGVEEKDIKTENYYLTPKYRYENTVCAYNTYCPPSNPILDGYQVSQMITVKVRDLSKAGDLISGVGGKGATDISSLSFTIDDDSTLKNEARQKAIADAKAKADALTKSLGVQIVRMTGYWEDQGGYYPMESKAYGMGGDMASEAAVAPSVPTGENTITSNISISYEVK